MKTGDVDASTGSPQSNTMTVTKQNKTRLTLLVMLGMTFGSPAQQLGPQGSDAGLSQIQQRQLPCDDRYQMCVDASGRPLTTNPVMQGGQSPINDYPEADTRYQFGNGIPLDMNQRDTRRSAYGQPQSIRFRPEPPTEFQKFVEAD